mgnify:CR=1 FL=1
MNYTIIIPARHASSRFPGKPLADIAGKPMVVRVAEQAARTGAEVIVATDHAPHPADYNAPEGQLLEEYYPLVEDQPGARSATCRCGSGVIPV